MHRTFLLLLIFYPVETYSKHSMPVLLVDAHFTVVEAALKGYMKWRSVHGSKLQQDVPNPLTSLLNFMLTFVGS